MRNPVARRLRESGQYVSRVVLSKKRYSRKGKKKKETDDDER